MHKKICRIHGELAQENITVEKSARYKSGFSLRCRICRLFGQLKYKEPRRQIIAKKQREYAKNNRDNINEWTREHRKRKPEIYKEAYQRKKNKYGQSLVDKEKSRRLGLTIEEYYNLWKLQKGFCGICRQEEKRKFKGKVIALCLDHHHKTGKVREFLCHGCNQVIGHSRESIEILENAILYLKKHSE